MSNDASANDALRTLAAELRNQRPQYPASQFSGRGIVIAAGGARIFTNAYVLIRLLRETLGSTLPIEVWHFGIEEMSPAMAALLQPFNVRIVDALPIIAAKAARIRDGWQLKPFAAMWSGFEEVLVLDADQVPVVDPAIVFEWPQYLAQGAVFWPDVVDLRRDNQVWDALGLPARRAISMESGQLVVDKRRHWRALVLTLQLNEAADQLYQMIYGDKDTFMLGWELAGADYALVPYRPFSDEYILLQRDFEGRNLFQHRSNAKWIYGGEQRRLAGFVHEAVCLDILAELRRHWSGRVFTAPDRTARARQTEEKLVLASRFDLDIGGEARTSLILRPHAEIGAGRSLDRQHWWIEEIDSGMQLVISDGSRRTYVFEQEGDNWRGRRLAAIVADAALRAHEAWANLPPVADPSRPGLVDDLLRGTDLRALGSDELLRLTEMFRWLARAVPGVAVRLQRLADDEKDEQLARPLADLAIAAGQGQQGRYRQPEKREVTSFAYQRADDSF